MVRSIVQDIYGEKPLRMQATALLALQEAGESHLISLFEDAQRCAIHGHRQTVMQKDTELTITIRNGNNQGSTATPGAVPKQ